MNKRMTFGILSSFLLISGMTVQAENMNAGGHNIYNSINARTYEEIEELERTVCNEGYILLSEDSTDITELEFTAFTENPFSNAFWFMKYIDVSEDFRVYVYEESFHNFLQEFEELHYVTDDTLIDIGCSSVAVDYTVAESLELMWTYSDMWGDNLPADANAGYIQVKTPIDVTVTFLSDSTHIYYQIPFPSGESAVRILRDGYQISNINGLDVSKEEALLPYTNHIYVQNEHDEVNPYILELTDFLDEYGFLTEDGVAYEEGQQVHYAPGSFDLTEPVTEAEEPLPEKKKVNAGIVFMLAVAAVLVFGFVVMYVTGRLNKRYFDGEDM